MQYIPPYLSSTVHTTDDQLAPSEVPRLVLGECCELLRSLVFCRYVYNCRFHSHLWRPSSSSGGASCWYLVSRICIALKPPHYLGRCTDKVLLNLMSNNYIKWEIWGSHSGVVEDSGLLECAGVSWGENFTANRNILTPLCWWSLSPIIHIP